MSGLQIGSRGNLKQLTRPLPGEELVSVLLDHVAVQEGFNPRGQVNPSALDEASLTELARSIREHGLLQPIIVRTRPLQPGRYWLIAGERRYRAALLNAQADRAAGRPVQRPQLLSLIRDVNDDVALELAIMENAQRRDLDLVEESLVGLNYLGKVTGLDPAALRSHLAVIRKDPSQDTHQLDALLRRLYGSGVSVWSQQRVRVLDLSEAERQAVTSGQLPFKVAVELSKLPPPERETMLEKAARGEVSAAQLREVRRPAPSSVAQQGAALRRALPKLSTLQGKAAKRAEQLLSELLALLGS